MASKSVPRLNPDGTNFLNWKKKLVSALDSIKIAYVLNDDPTVDIDQRTDLRCREHIMNSIDKDLSIMYQNCKTAKSLMDALTSHFKLTMSRRIALYRQFFNRQMAVDCPISRHVAQMGDVAAELEAAGVELSETVKAMALVNSLPKSWRDAVLTMMELEEDLTVKGVIQRLRSLRDTRALDSDSKISVDDMQTIILIGGYFVFYLYTVGAFKRG